MTYFIIGYGLVLLAGIVMLSVILYRHNHCEHEWGEPLTTGHPDGWIVTIKVCKKCGKAKWRFSV